MRIQESYLLGYVSSPVYIKQEVTSAPQYIRGGLPKKYDIVPDPQSHTCVSCKGRWDSEIMRTFYDAVHQMQNGKVQTEGYNQERAAMKTRRRNLRILRRGLWAWLRERDVIRRKYRWGWDSDICHHLFIYFFISVVMPYYYKVWKFPFKSDFIQDII